MSAYDKLDKLRIDFYKWRRNNIKEFNKLKQAYLDPVINPILAKGKPKIFCIGCNKTGTTSLNKAFEDLGYITGNQKKAERLIHDYFNNNYEAIISYCHSAQVFQDVPFSFPITYKYLDKAYPDAKFILTIRDTPEQWYKSLKRFHAKMFGRGELPTAIQLQNHPYVWKGWIWTYMHKLYNSGIVEPYKESQLTSHYQRHNNDVLNYFKSRSEKLLVINLANEDSYMKFCDFINIKPLYNNFPKENVTEKVRVRI